MFFLSLNKRTNQQLRTLLLLQGSTTPGSVTLGLVSRDRSGRWWCTTRATRGYASSFRRGSNLDSSDSREQKCRKIIVGIRCEHDAFIRGTLHRRNPTKTPIIPSFLEITVRACHWLLTSGRPYSPGTNESGSQESVGR